MSHIEKTVLELLHRDQVIESTLDIVDPVSGNTFNYEQQTSIRNVLNSLLGQEVVKFETLESIFYDLSDEAKNFIKEGSPEYRLYKAVPKGVELDVTELVQLLGDAVVKIGLGPAFKNKWLKKQGNAIVRIDDSATDKLASLLEDISLNKTAGVTDAVAKELKKRKLILETKAMYYRVTKGPKFTLNPQKPAADLTADMLASGQWKTLQFKPYNFDAEGTLPSSGYLHPLMKVRTEFQRIFFDLGFSEMPTNRFVESSFWNFDALFQPQQHPARDMHDTFFLKDPASSSVLPEDLVAKVKKVHSSGGYGSTGYEYDWKREEAEKMLLRTHTTAISSRMLYQIAEKYKKTGNFEPAKLFSIDRVFRNETVDATHLAEFHQVEGLIADRGLCLGDLIGFLNAFFQRMGVKSLRFKPAYNPYTEPSLEIFSFHEGLKTWVEIGNSGMFRPEMLLTLGLPEDVQVIAWGLSLERPTMIKYGIDNIRELLGHKVSLSMVQTNPICRLDKKMGREIAEEFDALKIAH